MLSGRPIKMKLAVVIFFVIAALINCQPIEEMGDKIVHRLTFNFTDASDNGVIDNVDARNSNLNSSERISMPQDVELVEPPRKNQRQQSLIPGIGPLIDMIFAVSSIEIHFEEFSETFFSFRIVIL